MFGLSFRQLNWAGCLACVGLMGYALYSQYVDGLQPCPLCVFQRIAVIALGVIFFAGAVVTVKSLQRWVVAPLALIAGLAGAGVAGRHAWLQHLPPDQVPACGPGLGHILNTFPLGEALSMVFEGSGECANVDWSFLGLSMPMWVFAWCVVLGFGGALINFRAAGEKDNS